MATKRDWKTVSNLLLKVTQDPHAQREHMDAFHLLLLLNGHGSPQKPAAKKATVADNPTKQPRWSWHMHSQRLPPAKSANSAPWKQSLCLKSSTSQCRIVSGVKNDSGSCSNLPDHSMTCHHSFDGSLQIWWPDWDSGAVITDFFESKGPRRHEAERVYNQYSQHNCTS